MAITTLLLWAGIAVLMIDSIIELSFISSMVSWLHRRAGRDFDVNYNGGTFPLHGKPLKLLVDQGHTSNGAAGTAFVLIGMGGILALLFRSRANRKPGTGFSKFGLAWYHSWLVFAILSALLSLAALVYTFVITHDHKGQTIDVALASTLDNQPYPNFVAYPEDEWTPENWFVAVLKLSLASSDDRDNIRSHLRVMRGWRWNLIPMFIVGLVVAVLAVVDAFYTRSAVREKRQLAGYGREAKRVPADSA